MTIDVSTAEVVALTVISLALVAVGILLDELWRWYDETHRRH